MKQPALAKGRAKYLGLINILRRRYLKLMGLNIKSGGTVGKINCNWPKNVRIGSDCAIEDEVSFRIYHPDSDQNYIQLGDRVVIGRGCSFNCTSRIIVGDDTLIGSQTIIVDSNHEFKKESTINSQPVVRGDVIIGNDVGIGIGSIVLHGISIGNGSLIAAGSLINKSIGEYEMWGGVPIRFYGKRQ